MRGSRGFTLLELLVVISIIVLLIALLLPALTVAKDNAKTVMCRSNLYQMVMAYTMYATDEEGFYPMITPTFQHSWPPNVTTWQNQSSRATVGWGDAVGHGLLYKTGYFNNWLAVRCPGRDYEDWPAYNIDDFLDPPPWPTDPYPIDHDGNEYPAGTLTHFRGWEFSVADWRTPDQRQAINSDLILNIYVMIGWPGGGHPPTDQGDGAHPNGLNVGFSDASATFVSMDTPWDDTKTFKEQLLEWNPNPWGPFGIPNHLLTYKFFDKQ